MTQIDQASERQIQAARPGSSTWLAANAGSGKTKVLTDRVARLLLNGVEPQHILCLTYTKAAASEMQIRLFRRLGSWAMLDDGRLAGELDALGAGTDTTADKLSRARTLFARAIETPGGLKIQTIHSFCASLLRRFPLEAGVSPQFSEMEDRAGALLRAEIIEDFSDGPQSGLIDAIARYVTDAGLEDLMASVARMREAFIAPPGWAELAGLFNLPVEFDETELEARVFDGGEAGIIAKLVEVLKEGLKSDIKAAAALVKIGPPGLSDLPALESVFLTGGSAKEPFSPKIDSFPTKDLRARHPDLMTEVEPLMQRVAEARPPRLKLAAARRSQALFQFAAEFLPEYELRKQLRGWLDFDDLILKTRKLLNDPAVAAWVLFRLDGGLDHILVDEAQDTSPAQWDVIEKLAQEFTSGHGARPDKERTIFVVGDKKQSIYSFQGADPEAFDRMQADFSDRLKNVGSSLDSLTLEHSFRSSEAILRLVDLVFADQAEAGFRKESQHRAFKTDLPGRVDLWPVVEKIDDDDNREWTDPVDRPGAKHHTVVLADRIARFIKRTIDDGETIPIDGPQTGTFQRRPVHAGDFLILVQRRSDLFAEIIRACKAAGLPIAGADRLKVGAEMAVKDLASLLSFLATPEDGLSLAEALKSPLFGWTEQLMFDLAHRRGDKYLWQALRDRHAEFGQTIAVLNDLRGQTDFLRPYDLIERILTRHDGRRRLIARLGREAEDGINALLSQALAYERSSVPSLTGFLVWMQTDDLEVKRQMGGAGDMIRVMTVHGAKGLESPIVLLPDTAARRPPRDGDIILADGKPLWRTPVVEMPALLASAREVARARQNNERLRLLYVAVTRAEKWLIVAAAGDLGSAGDSWYQMVVSGLADTGALPHDFDGGRGLRLSHLDWHGPELISNPVESRTLDPLPELFFRPADVPASAPTTVSPSDLGGAKALAGEFGLDEDAAMQRGTRIHLLLEDLADVPLDDWLSSARNILTDVAEKDLAGLLDEVRVVRTNPDLDRIFSHDALTEVSVTAPVGSARIHGAIDRLIVSDTSVLAVDFKTNVTVPATPADCPEGILRQMGAYALALRQIFPGRQVETAILWTRVAQLMILPDELVEAAVLRSPRLDDVGSPS